MNRWTTAGLLLLLTTSPLVAQSDCPCPSQEEAPEPLWTTKIGASYLATTGNTETTTFGSSIEVKREPTPWGLEVQATYDRAEDGDELQSERLFASVRARRALGDRWDLFSGATAESNEFAGFDPRFVLSTGVTYHALTGPVHTLDLDAGLAYTDVDRIEPEEDESYLGAVIGASYEAKISESSTFRQRLVWHPNFDESSDWRLESFTALEASLSQRLALRLGYEVRFENEPAGNRDDTDTTARASIVLDL